jgi:hypothetical protein
MSRQIQRELTPAATCALWLNGTGCGATALGKRSSGALVIWVEPNNAGVPPGILAVVTGSLIHERVFLTCGHCTRESEPGIPPFIKPYVTFSLHVMDDPSTWIPVAAQAWHPSTLPGKRNF